MSEFSKNESHRDTRPGAEHEETSRHPVGADGIVAGYDGSPASASTLNFALELADRLEAPLTVVRAWSVDTAPHGTLMEHGYVIPFAEASLKIRQHLIVDTRAVVESRPGVTVSFRAVLGQSAAVLIEASAGSRMLVVGSRGRGGFSSLMLGSVSEQCVRHARCPVVVYRPSSPIDADDSARTKGVRRHG
jgi:nucleotide-binding universal stress UspA family protein